MPNAQSLEKGKKALLVVSNTGTGKTFQFLTLPGRKFIYMFDPSGLDTISGFDVTYEYFPPSSSVAIKKTKTGTAGPRVKGSPENSYRTFEEHAEKFLDNSLDPELYGYTGVQDFDCIAFDSTTSLEMLTMDYVLFINGRPDRIPEISDYMLVGDALLAIYRRFLNLPDKLIYITGHTDLAQDEVSKKILYQFDTRKQVRRLLPRFVSDYWAIVSSGGKFTLLTCPTKEYPDAKNSFGLPPSVDITIQGKPRVGDGIGKFFSKKGA